METQGRENTTAGIDARGKVLGGGRLGSGARCCPARGVSQAEGRSSLACPALRGGDVRESRGRGDEMLRLGGCTTPAQHNETLTMQKTEGKGVKELH